MTHVRPLRPTSSGLRMNVGLSGSGKTYSIRRDLVAAVAGGMPVAVLDMVGEWETVPVELEDVAVVVDSPEHVRAAITEGYRLVVVDALELDEDAAKDAADYLAAWSRERGRAEIRGLAIPECHNVCPEGGKIPRHLMKVATAWRHGGVAAWLDTQRLAIVSKSFTDLARELRLFAVAGDADLKAVKRQGTDGQELVASVTQAARILAPHDPDDAAKPACAAGTCQHTGWCVTLDSTRIPPYPLIRAGSGETWRGTDA